MNKYASYILYLLISILVVILFINDFGPMQRLQRSLDDLLCGITAVDGPRPGVAIVRIDNRAIKTFGNWPWNRDLIADLTAAVASAEPKAVVLDFELSEDASQDSAGFTGILAEQLNWIQQAVLPYDITMATFRSNKTSNPPQLFRNSVAVNNRLGLMDEKASLIVRKLFLPADKLVAHKPYLGFSYYCPDDDRVLRHQPLLMNYEGYYYPSLSLLTSAVALGVKPQEIVVEEGKEIRLGSVRTIPINERSEFFISFPFVEYSAADVLGSGFDFGKFKGKVIMIGVAENDAEELLATPAGAKVSPLLAEATVIENIINDNMLTVRDDLATAELIALLVLGGACAFILPRVTLLYRMVILLGALIVLANLEYIFFSSSRMIVQIVYVALELLLFMLASPLLDTALMTGGMPAKATSSAKSRKASGPSKQATSDVPVRELKAASNDPINIATTALGSRDDRAAGDSSAIDHQTLHLDDAAAAPPAAHGETASAPMAKDPEPPDQPVEYVADDHIPGIGEVGLSDDGFDSQGAPVPGATPDIRNLGRYQVNGVLGKGAMGTVYKGIDPAINRPVALKTIRLDFVTDPEELAELKERLHREAQAAGKLSHPNIVTIYDVGSQGSLQYIAMEYLEGQTLESLIRKKVRFNYRIIAQIISQICLALDYAHERGIVHRDIKPANIMVLSDYRVKVMDFGIARVDSNSMTKTGIAMGTPNYISPEQLKGLPMDRRADLFSLGVVMYEMLLGRRPFKGENITSLMYAIMNREPEKPSSVNPQVPLLFDHIILRALKKDPIARYQKASEIQADLKDFVESFTR
jgi:CHASE2 domain-containing sensor protein/predicted Ser/Thr protein kinase